MSRFSIFYGKKWVTTLFLFLVTIPFALLAVYLIVLPMQNFSHSLAPTKEEKAEYDSLTAASEGAYADQIDKLRGLRLENASLQALLQAARTDSVYFVLNLKDSVLSINIKGVPVRKSKLNRHYRSAALEIVKDSPQAEGWLSKPLIARKSWSSFVKHPYKIKNAPRDTLEAMAMKMDIMKPEPIDAYCAILFDRNVLLRMRQVEPPSREGWRKRLSYEASYRLDRLKEIIDAAARREIPQHYLIIDLALPRNDIVAMYRAVPHRCQMVLIF
ncbi:MAG: hypothetical protein ONA69_00045 [candidate division KSB1 bacterium]|nr:hypothetical protein [candidate division KSB1 bacterium]MDZ7345161.1 hypothetical protein [candidate division KSB1 bacterium]